MKKEENSKMSKNDKVIKVSVNEETVEKLDTVVKMTGKTRSAILRELIPIVSSKDFEGMISNTRMEVLQDYSDQCWKMLHTQGCIFEVEDLSQRMPAFIANKEEQPVVFVKYPTFGIQIFDGDNKKKATNQEHLEKLLQNVENRSEVYYKRADYLVAGKRMELMEFPYINEVMCLGTRIKDNTQCKDKIIELLKKEGYGFFVFTSYCIRGISVELLEDGKYFKVRQ